MLRRATTLFAFLGTLLLAGNAVAQEKVSVRAINFIPDANIDQLNALGANLTADDVNSGFCAGLLYDGTMCGDVVEIEVVILTDPLNSGLSTPGDAGQPSRIHVFARDISASVDGNGGQGIQIVDGSKLGLKNLLRGDVITVVGQINPFFTTHQFVPTSITYVTSLDPSGGDPIFDPIVATTEEVNMDMGPDGAAQINWDNYSKFISNYVVFEDATVVQSTPSDRPDFAITTDADPSGGGSFVAKYDTSLRFRNDRSSQNAEYNVLTEDYFPPVPGSSVNVKGFLTFPGIAGSDPYAQAVPFGTVLAINPMADSDMEVLEEPIKVVNVEFADIPTSTGTTDVTADIFVSPGRNFSNAALYWFTDQDATVKSDNPSFPVGNTFTFELGAEPDESFVTFWIEANDDGGGQFITDPTVLRVLDNGITKIEHIQRTLNDVFGDGPFAGQTFDMDITATVSWQRGRSGDGYIQDGDNTTSWSGLFFDDNSLGALAPGTQIHITKADISESFTLTRIRNVEYTVVGPVTPFAPKVMSTTALADLDIAEANEGMWVRVEGAVVTATNADAPSGPFGEFTISTDGGGSNLRIDDNSEAFSYPDDDPASMFSVWEKLEFVQGVLHYSFGNFKITPQLLSDMGPVVNVGTENSDIPTAFALEQNYPNPFNPVTRINFEMNETAFVTLEVFDALGRRVATLVNEERFAGFHSVEFDARNYSSGIYMYRITSGAETQLKKMILLK